MKTQLFRVWALGVGITTVLLGAGCQQQEARAEVPVADQVVPQIVAADPPKSNVAVPDATKFEAPVAPVNLAGAPELERTNVSTNVAMPKLVQAPTIPNELQVSPALEEILKLAQAGVAEEVMLAYITSSTTFFNVTSDAIVYLNDLGVSNEVITALIQHDSTPEMQARKQMANAVQPLPKDIALTSPATNIYPPAVTQTTDVATTPDIGVAPPPPTEAEATNIAPPAEQPASVSYFYSSLAPYGTWIDVDGYGLCWQPTVVVSQRDWRPYGDRGRWLWSNHGWYWYSDYSWGWAPFHYGRWHDYPRVGWIWVPDTHWGPSWVSWRYSSSYCGWAPLPPDCHYRSGLGFYYHGRSVGFGFDFGLSFHHYNYVPFNRFCDRSPGLHFVRGDRARGVHRETTVVNNYVVGNNNTIINNGVGRDRVARANRGQVPTATVRETTTRAGMRREQLVSNGSQLAVVRPSLPSAPERSHVSVPTRSGIRRGGDVAVPASAASRGEGNSAIPNRSGLGRGSVVRPERPIDGSAPIARNAEPASRDSDNRNTPVVRGSRPDLASPRATTEPIRPNSSGFRSYNRPAAPAPRNEQQVAVNNSAPAPATRGEVRTPQARSTPNVTAPQPNVGRPSNPSSAPTSRPVVPNRSGIRNDAPRSYANPGVSSRPSTPLPQVSRPAPQANTPAPSRPNVSSPASRPEVSRSAPSYSPPVQRSAPSYSPPVQRSAPSYTPAPNRSSGFGAPAARSAPSYSAPAPSRSSGPSGGGGGGGGGRGSRGRD
jgi:hypothetical protein